MRGAEAGNYEPYKSYGEKFPAERNKVDEAILMILDRVFHRCGSSLQILERVTRE